MNEHTEEPAHGESTLTPLRDHPPPGAASPFPAAESGDGVQFVPTRFSYGDDFDVMWQPAIPEFTCAANGVSLLMPYVEPYVVDSVRDVIPQLSAELATEATAYVRQEGQHHAQHRRFNDLVVARFPALRRIEVVMAATYRNLGRAGPEFGVAFAAGFEAVAYAAARWTADHQRQLFVGADENAANLFLWHLAEEVEHKAVAVDVYRAIGGRKRTYIVAMLASAVLLAFFSWLATTTMLLSTRRFFSPVAHLRLLLWTISFLFELLPTMVLSVFPSQHPSDSVDPLLYEVWLAEHRPTPGR